MREAVLDLTSQPGQNLCSVGSGVAYNSTSMGIASQWAPWAGNGGVGPTTYNIAAAWSRTGKCARITWTTPPTSGGDMGVLFSGLAENTTYSAVVTMVSSWDTITALRVGNYAITGGAIGSGTGTTIYADTVSVAQKVGVPITMRVVFKTGPATTSAKVYAGPYSSGALPIVNSTLDASMVRLTQGDIRDLDYADGDTPGWRWTGAANTSVSVGYPYTLDSLAGRPAAWYEARSLLGRGVALPADGTQVDRWVDLSGNGRDLTQPTAAKRPVFRSINPNRFPYDLATSASGSNGWNLAPTPGVTGAVNTTNPIPGTLASFTVTVNDVVAANNQLRCNTGGAGGRIPVVPGGTYYGYVKVRNDAPTARTITAYLECFNSAGAYISSPNFGSASVPAGQTVTFTGPITTPALAATHNLLVVATNGVVNGDAMTVSQAVASTAPIPFWAPPIPLPVGQPLVLADGVDDFLSCTIGDLPGLTIYAVYRGESASSKAWGRLYGFGNTGSDMLVFNRANLTGDSSGRVDLAASGAPYNQTLGNLTGGWNATTRVHSVRIDLTTGARQQRLDGAGGIAGTLTIAGGSLTFGPVLSVFAETVGGTPSDAALAALIFYPQVHDDTTRNRIEKWLGKQYAVTVA